MRGHQVVDINVVIIILSVSLWRCPIRRVRGSFSRLRVYVESSTFGCGWIGSWASETDAKSDAIMSLKNYIFASINTKSNSSNQLPFEDIPLPHSRNRTMTSNLTPVPELPSNGNAATPPKSQNWLKKAWSFVSVEPVMICWILPSCFLYIAIENLALEKVR